jgi:hypothetical protein
MAYSTFSFDQLKHEFSLTIVEKVELFAPIQAIQPPEELVATLADNVPLALAVNTEKAKSELIISPILVEVRRMVHKQISLFSGIELNVEEEKGLRGICDFIISLSPEQFFLEAPLVTIVEAKKDNVTAGIPQCIAEMKAAQLFNDRRKNAIPILYGVVTTGNLWKFLKLDGPQVSIDLDEYHIKELNKILGILLSMVGYKV